MNDLTQAAAPDQQPVFRQFRTDVEASVDDCLAGVVVAGCTPTPSGIDYYRFSRYAVPATYPLDPLGGGGTAPTGVNAWRYFLQSFVQRLNDRLGDPPSPAAGPADPVRDSMYRQTVRLRYELAVASIETVLTQIALGRPDGTPGVFVDLDFTTSGVPSIHQVEQTAQAGFETWTIQDDLAGAWAGFGNNILANLDFQVYSTFGLNPFSTEYSKASTYASTVQQVLLPTSTFLETYQTMILATGTNAELQLIFTDVDVGASGGMVYPTVQDDAITDLEFFASVNSPFLPVGAPAPDTIP